MIYIGGLIVVLGVLIFVHELGHFLAAKSVGIAVHRFSLGLGPLTPLRFKRGETEYCVSWIPFGGYVKMAGLEEEGAAGSLEGPREEADIPPERTFDAKPLWARIYVISAGVLMNGLFAVLVYTYLAGVHGIPVDTSTIVGEVRAAELPMGAAPLTAVRPGDRIIRINGDTVRGWRDVMDRLLTTVETPIRLEVAGRSEPVLIDVPLREQENRGKLIQALLPWHEPVLGEVVAGWPAAEAGLRPGDRVLRVFGDTIPAWEVFHGRLQGSAGETLTVDVARGDSLLSVVVVPRAVRVAAPGGQTREVGQIGIRQYRPVTRPGPLGAVREGLRETGGAIGLVVFTLKGLVLGQLSPRDLGGPILIGQLAGEAARLGTVAFLNLLALISVNLAVLNLLPIPVLDGGHLLFLAIEGIRRRPLSVVVRQRLTAVGFWLLIAIMVFAIRNDLLRVFDRFLD